MKVLIVGLGSIGSRHLRILDEMNIDTAICSRRSLSIDQKVFHGLSEALEGFNPDAIIVSNSTNEHMTTCLELAQLGFRGRLLIEKPVFHTYSEDLPHDQFQSISVAYNLRFHPLMDLLKTKIHGEEIIAVGAYVGQFLPSWRPDRDYREVYSSSVSKGGGVLRDLSHELDYIQWMFGRWISVVALGGKFSNLDIDSEDCYSMLIESEKCKNINLQMNYIDRIPKREIVVHTNTDSIKIDLVKGLISHKDGEDYLPTESDETYHRMLRDFLFEEDNRICSFSEGLEVMSLIEACERSCEQRRWVWRK